jgi:predicted negative regulator of RcsB-dependent stress response
MAKVRNIAFVIVSILAVLAGYLYWNAMQQRKTAEEQRKVAETQTKLAQEQKEQADAVVESLNQHRGNTRRAASMRIIPRRHYAIVRDLEVSADV